MKILTFKRQVILGIIIIIVGNIFAFVFHNGIFSNIVWIMYGLLFIINPVYPEQYIIERKGKIGARKREFAMLQAVGMTGKQLKRMLILHRCGKIL